MIRSCRPTESHAMRLYRRILAVLFTAGLFAVGLGKIAPPAAAAEECPADRLCLYSSTELRGLKFAAASTKACCT